MLISSVSKNRRILAKYNKFFNVIVFKNMVTSSPASSIASEKSKHYDIIIAGGGLVGTTLACSLSKNNVLKDKSVLLLEGAPAFKGFQPGQDYSNRVSALSKGTRDLMKSIGAWKLITETRHKPVKQMQVWDALSDTQIIFNHEDSSDDVCYIVENDLVIDSVLKVLNSCGNVKIENNSRIGGCTLANDSPVGKSSVTLKSGESYECDLLIGADGVNSIVRESMEDKHKYSTNYNQMGVVATVELADAEDNSVAWQRFLPTGPVALLPLNEKMSSIVWTTTPEHAKKLISMAPEEFVNELNSAFVREYKKDELTLKATRALDAFMGKSEMNRQLPPTVTNVKDKSRAGFPLGFSVSSVYVKQGVALIGDAAHRVHPLAGQGVNLGFGDVKNLTEILSDAVYNGQKLGDLNYLLKYEQARLQHNVPIMLGVHGIQQIYGTEISLLVLARSIGVKVTNSVPFLKKFFMSKAMA